MSSVMSLRALCLRPAWPLRSLRSVTVQARPLSVSAVLRHKESEAKDPDFAVEKLKEESLEHQKRGSGQWMAGLASDSEEAIKADKSSGPNPPTATGTKAKTPPGPNKPTTVRA